MQVLRIIVLLDHALRNGIVATLRDGQDGHMMDSVLRGCVIDELLRLIEVVDTLLDQTLYIVAEIYSPLVLPLVPKLLLLWEELHLASFDMSC